MTKSIELAVKNGTIEDKIAKLKARKEFIEAKIDECQKALEESKKPKLAIPFVPKLGEKYYFYIPDGSIFDSENKNTTGDIPLIEIGNTFRTGEETKLAHERRCAETELLVMCDGLEEETCFIPYFYDKEWHAEYFRWCKFCPYRFISKKSCQEAIDKLGDRKLRLIFNIPLER